MILPLYVALEKIDFAAHRGGRGPVRATALAAFRRVTLPLALPGVFAGSLLTFIPAMGDYINAELLGNPQTRMIGNVIQNRLLIQNDYPVGLGPVVHPHGRDPRRRGHLRPPARHRAADRLMADRDDAPRRAAPHDGGGPQRSGEFWRGLEPLDPAGRSRRSRSSTCWSRSP